MTTKGLTFWLDSSELNHINVDVTLIEHKTGEIEITAVCGNEQIGTLLTSIKGIKYHKESD